MCEPTGMSNGWTPPTHLLHQVVADLTETRSEVDHDTWQNGAYEVVQALSFLPEAVERARNEFDAAHTDDEDGLVTCWTIQRTPVWEKAEQAGTHVASWDTVRIDRRPQYAFVSAALRADGFHFPSEEATPPPIWAYTSQPPFSGQPRPLSFWICDSSCGAGLPTAACSKTHIPPGHVAIERQLTVDEFVGLSWMRWDIALRGQYVPADNLDGYRFGVALSGLVGDDADTMPARYWPWKLRAVARASMLRCFTADNQLPGIVRENDHMTPGWYRNQVVTPSINIGDVTDVREGPSTEQEDWWDAAVACDPQTAAWRRNATLPVDQLHLPGDEDDSV